MTYQWLFNDSTSEASNLSFTIPLNLDFQYQLIIGEKGRCFDTIPMTENVRGVSPLKDLSHYTICDSDDTTRLLLELNIVSDSDYAVTWGNFTDTLYNNDVIPIRKEEILRLNNRIPVAILYDDNCILRDTVVVNFKQIQVNIQAQPTKVYKGQEVVLSTIPTDFKEYKWFPPDVLNADDIPMVNAIIEETTDFIVLVKDTDGCVATDTMKVEVLTECSLKRIFIPTAFTPNGDGVNDILRVRSEANIQIEYVVYNRWGEKVFETNDLSKGWDGYYKGKPADKGAYAYYLKIICEDKSELYNQGNITLIR
ncbi:MAG: gliding motility-associated C-terminal domain-containing protein [Chitinophagales bacterium]|nr:gliding motility-associated C-terminal domain-containing protein [Chitinophagales bacterium]